MDIGPGLEAFQHDRLIVAHNLGVHADGVARQLHTAGIILELLVVSHWLLTIIHIIDVSVVIDTALGVHHNNGNGVVLLDDTQHQRQVRRLVGLV